MNLSLALKTVLPPIDIQQSCSTLQKSNNHQFSQKARNPRAARHLGFLLFTPPENSDFPSSFSRNTVFPAPHPVSLPHRCGLIASFKPLQTRV
jgi:hypothetical protein